MRQYGSPPPRAVNVNAGEVRKPPTPCLEAINGMVDVYSKLGASAERRERESRRR